MPAQSALLNVMTAAARKAGAQPQARLRRGREPAGLAERPGELRLGRRPSRRGDPAHRAARRRGRATASSARKAASREGTDKTHTWIVDPLDGTTNFLHGIPHFAISIALVREGTPIAGLIYNPANDEFFTAERGKGAFLNNRRIRVAARKRLAEAVVCCALPHHGRGDLALFRREMAAIQDKVAGLRRFGAAALDLAYVAAGRFDAYWERGLSAWDFAAGVLIVREAGGFVTDLEDNERTMEPGDVIAGNETMHRQVLDLLQAA